MKIIFSILLSAIFLLSPEEGRAEIPSGNELSISTEKVIVFKDGYAMVIKKATGFTNDKGELFTNDVPESAILGSFWAVTQEGKLLSMKAGWYDNEKHKMVEEDCQNNFEILQSNVGEHCRFVINGRNLSGTILKVLSKKSKVNMGSKHFSKLSNSDHVELIERWTGSQFILRNADGDQLISSHKIESLTIKDMKSKIKKKVSVKTHRKRLIFNFEEANTERTFTIMYFRPGFRWIPTYRINLKDNNKADISLQAEILNEAEDLKDVPLDIVVGVPHFKFKNNVSPLILERSLRRTLGQAHPNLMNKSQRFSNASYGSRSTEFRRAAAQSSVNIPASLNANAKGDLFIYSLAKVDIKKGERMAIQIFTSEVSYKDVYTWELDVKQAGNALSPSGSGLQSPLVLSQNKIWHQIVLTNSTNVPWTTGAAMIMKGQQPLGQDLLTYTSPKDVVRVPVTVSTEVRGLISGKEVKRDLKNIIYRRYHYAKIFKQAKLSICNHKASEVDLEISMNIGGRVDKAGEKGVVTLNSHNSTLWHHYYGDTAVNNSSKVVWKTSLKSGELFEPEVDYHFYVRH